LHKATATPQKAKLKILFLIFNIDSGTPRKEHLNIKTFPEISPHLPIPNEPFPIYK
jgi:hypothetical protein